MPLAVATFGESLLRAFGALYPAIGFDMSENRVKTGTELQQPAQRPSYLGRIRLCKGHPLPDLRSDFKTRRSMPPICRRPSARSPSMPALAVLWSSRVACRSV